MSDKRRSIDTSGIDSIIGYRLRRAQTTVFGRFMQRFAEVEVKPADYSVLVLIADNAGLRPSQIAAALGIQRANFVALANALEERGLIVREQASADRRAHTLDLTPAGRALVDKMRAIQEDFEAELIAELGGPEARDTLLALLARLR